MKIDAENKKMFLKLIKAKPSLPRTKIEAERLVSEKKDQKRLDPLLLLQRYHSNYTICPSLFHVVELKPDKHGTVNGYWLKKEKFYEENLGDYQSGFYISDNKMQNELIE